MGEAAARHLPNADHSIVEQRKVTQYLLNLDHPQGGGSRARFFIARGFAPADPGTLQASLLIQGGVNTVTRSIDTPWGTR